MRTGKELIYILEEYDEDTGELTERTKYNIIGDPDRVNPFDSAKCENVETFEWDWEPVGNYVCVNEAYEVTYEFEWELELNNYSCVTNGE